MLNKTALIVGMAKSGIGAAKLLCRHGWHVVINDMKSEIPGLEDAVAADLEMIREKGAEEAFASCL